MRNLTADIHELKRVALAAVDPARAVREHVRCSEQQLLIGDRAFPLSQYERILVVGGGKAVVPMTAAVADILGERLAAGAIVTKYGHGELPPTQVTRRISLIHAGHPVPDENSVRGARAVAEMVSGAADRDLILCLISGGGSALLTYPVPGLTLAQLQNLTGALLRSGATINEMNTVRKHWSQIKGGHLAQLATPATVVTLILSDVVGDPLEVIASGPTVPDPTTVDDARAVLARYSIELEMGASGQASWSFLETPKPGDTAFERVHHLLIGSNRLAAAAARERARELGYNALLLSTFVEGEAREVAKVAAALAKGSRIHGDPLAPPACLIWGGETTVTIHGQGRGGRNQELALAAALALEDWPGVCLMALATDGTDGPTDAGGAVISGETVRQARALGVDPLAAIESNDSYSFFEATGGMIRTGPTGTNVNDLLFLLVGEA